MFTIVSSCIFVFSQTLIWKDITHLRNRNRLVLLCMGSISAGEETRLHLTTKSAVAAANVIAKVLAACVSCPKQPGMQFASAAKWATQIWPYSLGVVHRVYGAVRCLCLNSIPLRHSFGSKIPKLKHKQPQKSLQCIYCISILLLWKSSSHISSTHWVTGISNLHTGL